MSLFGALMAGLDDDPFFGGHRSIMRQMDQMMNTMMRDPFENDPFFGRGGGGGGGGGGLQAITAGPTAGPLARRPRTAPNSPPSRAVASPFGALGIPSIGNMMSSLDQMAQTGNCHMYSSSSVMTMTTGPDGRPQVYQATSSTTGVPGGVKETRRTISDSRTGTRKMAIGHHIGERSHIIERESNRGNDVEERQEFINLDEEEAPQFDREFRQRTQHQGMGRPGSLEYRRSRHSSPPASYNPRARHSTPPASYTPRVPAITASATPSSREEWARRRDREERGHRSYRRYQPTM
ncbi:myeloid leukemia factor 2-like isoform X2 [Eriocheir sinensis]|uniref:myeloid leukemia factor 2-like isoform X2 n=1 Tax=Eriocheir sinensis TaxID=95602 RepID=UPI0021C754ED|nr:myeloid leukemia factor 2-like isoform X2 [Eriocheir sinensis]